MSPPGHATGSAVEGGRREGGRWPDHVERACALLAAGGGRYTGDPGPHEARVVQVMQRPESTVHVIALRGQRGERSFYLKTLDPREVGRAQRVAEIRTEHRVLSGLGEHFRGSEHLGVVTPVAVMPDDLALLTEGSAGRTLDELIPWCWGAGRRRGEDIGLLCRRAGEWLRHFQEHTRPESPRSWDPGEILSYCEERLRIIRAAWPREVEDGFGAAVRQFMGRLAAGMTAAELQATGCHNDFRPENILAKDGRIIVLDLTGFRYGPPLYDYMKFRLKLEDFAFGRVGRGAAVRRLQARFAEGYGGRAHLDGSVAAMLGVAGFLDKMSEISEGSDRSLPRRLVARRWFVHLRRRVRQVMRMKKDTYEPPRA